MAKYLQLNSYAHVNEKDNFIHTSPIAHNLMEYWFCIGALL